MIAAALTPECWFDDIGKDCTMEHEVQKRYLTIPEAAELLGISVYTLRNRVAPSAEKPFEINGKPFKVIRAGRLVRFDRIALEKAMNSN